MNKKSYIILFILFSVLLQSCFVSKKYTRNEALLVQPDMFRAEINQKDSSSIANIVWGEFFKDTLLKNYIDVALKENLDLKISKLTSFITGEEVSPSLSKYHIELLIEQLIYMKSYSNVLKERIEDL